MSGYRRKSITIYQIILDEKDLIYKCANRNAKAQKHLFEKYYQKMYCVAMRYLTNNEDAKDVLAESFIRIINNINSFRYEGEGSLAKWIITIVINESLRALQKRKIIFYQENINENHLETNEDIEGHLEMEYILTLLEKMPDGYRIVFNLYVIEDYSHSEISELLGISVSTSKTQLFKARRHLITQLKKNNVYEMGRN